MGPRRLSTRAAAAASPRTIPRRSSTRAAAAVIGSDRPRIAPRTSHRPRASTIASRRIVARRGGAGIGEVVATMPDWMKKLGSFRNLGQMASYTSLAGANCGEYLVYYLFKVA